MIIIIDWITKAFLIYLALRLAAWLILRAAVWRAYAAAKDLDEIYRKYGYTRGAIETAGFTEITDRLHKTGGWWYRFGVPLASFLMYWPWGPKYYVRRMSAAYDRVGEFRGASGSFDASTDVIVGYATNSNYYPSAHIKGLCMALLVAPLLVSIPRLIQHIRFGLLFLRAQLLTKEQIAGALNVTLETVEIVTSEFVTHGWIKPYKEQQGVWILASAF